MATFYGLSVMVLEGLREELQTALRANTPLQQQQWRNHEMVTLLHLAGMHNNYGKHLVVYLSCGVAVTAPWGVEMVRLLLEHGVAQLPDAAGNTPLHVAAQFRPNQPEV